MICATCAALRLNNFHLTMIIRQDSIVVFFADVVILG
jgi:hypothetical protein